MDTNFLFACGLAIAVNSLILYVVIAAATRSSKRADYEWAQLEILIKMARVQGVSEEEIKHTLKQINPFIK